MNACGEEGCGMARWRDGADPTKCLGHQELLVTLMPAEIVARYPELDVEDVVDFSLETDGGVLCWECGSKAPRSMGLWDNPLGEAGEPMCLECGEMAGAKLRLDASGDNF